MRPSASRTGPRTLLDVVEPQDVNANLFRLLVVAPMKSASTYTANLLRVYYGIDDDVPELAHVDFSAEHNLTPWLCYDVRGRAFCFNFHMLPHASNLVAAEHERIELVALWRNLGDMILSMDDHQFTEGGNAPALFMLDADRYRALPAQARYAFMIDTLMPWYLAFYLRWRSVDMILRPYEQMLLDRRGYYMDMLTGILKDVQPDLRRLDEVLEIRPGRVSRFNVGIAGRSADKFGDAAKRRLEDRLLSHPDLEQLEILLWELPWAVPALERRSPLDGQVVQVAGEGIPFFVSRGVTHPILRRAWLRCRVGERRVPKLVRKGVLSRLPVGAPLL